MEVATAVLHPFLLQISGSDGDLVRTGADGGVEVDPIGVKGDAVVLARSNIIELGHAPSLIQAVTVARAVVGQLNFLRVTDIGPVPVVDEGAIVDDVGVRLRILEARIVILQIDSPAECDRAAASASAA